jgi:hypothetical protein
MSAPKNLRVFRVLLTFILLLAGMTVAALATVAPTTLRCGNLTIP